MTVRALDWYLWSALGTALLASTPLQGKYRTLEVETHIICYNRDVNGCYTNGLRSKYRGTGWETNLPWGYFDAQVDDDHNYPNWTVGSADTRGMRAGVSYWTWIYAFKGSDNYTSGATAFQVVAPEV